MRCVESVEYSVLMNGTPYEVIKPERGIRQEDPLSPYLFLICAEGFSNLLNREEALSHFNGLRINMHCPSISHLFFADDSLVFCRASEKDCRCIEGILKSYEMALGQTINLDKSSFMTNKNVSDEKKKRFSDILEIKHSTFICQYLGMPSQNNRCKGSLFQSLKSKVGKVLQGWMENLFSSGGKEILIKAIAQAIPSYTMSCFKLPSGLCEDINKACA